MTTHHRSPTLRRRLLLLLLAAVGAAVCLRAQAGPEAPQVTPAQIARGKSMCDNADNLLKQGKAEEALDAYEEVLTFLPLSPRAKAGVAQCQARLGRGTTPSAPGGAAGGRPGGAEAPSGKESQLLLLIVGGVVVIVGLVAATRRRGRRGRSGIRGEMLGAGVGEGVSASPPAEAAALAVAAAGAGAAVSAAQEPPLDAEASQVSPLAPAEAPSLQTTPESPFAFDADTEVAAAPQAQEAPEAAETAPAAGDQVGISLPPAPEAETVPAETPEAAETAPAAGPFGLEAAAVEPVPPPTAEAAPTAEHPPAAAPEAEEPLAPPAAPAAPPLFSPFGPAPGVSAGPSSAPAVEAPAPAEPAGPAPPAAYSPFDLEPAEPVGAAWIGREQAAARARAWWDASERSSDTCEVCGAVLARGEGYHLEEAEMLRSESYMAFASQMGAMFGVEEAQAQMQAEARVKEHAGCWRLCQACVNQHFTG